MHIYQDTREQQPLIFMGHTVEKFKLDEGDYLTKTLYDYEQETGAKTVRIERKKSTAELATNLGKDFVRFEKEMQRLFPYERKIILCEFTYNDILKFPEGSGIPKNKWFKKTKKGRMVKNIRMTPDLILNKLEYIQNIYNIEIIYAGDSYTAARKVEEIFNDIEKTLKK